MTADAVIDRGVRVPGSADTRIPLAGTHRRGGRPPRLRDALDFWNLAGAAANVIMQMSNPAVGHGVVESPVESGALFSHPWKRFRTTTQYLAVAILGSRAEIDAYREAINTAHRQIRSKPGAPVKYNAFDRRLQLWVAACLYVGFEDTYQLLNGRMSPEQAEAFYADSHTLATGVQVPRDMWPATRADFEIYWNEAAREAVIDDTVRVYVDGLVNLRMINAPMRLMFRNLLKFLTYGSLGPWFRDQLGVRWTAADQRRFEHLFLFVGFVNRFLPRPLRFAAAYRLMWDLRWRMRRNRSLI